MEFDPFAPQQDSPPPGQQWSAGTRQSSPEPPPPLPQWQPGQYGGQPQPQQDFWARQPQWWPQNEPETWGAGRFAPRRRVRARGLATLIGSLIGVAGVVIAVLALTLVHDSSSSPSPAIPSAPVSLPAVSGQSGAPAGASTATLVVTGSSGAQVAYGPAGSDIAGSVPMRKTVALGSASTYEIKALLIGGGSLKCEILVGNQVISQATASGADGVAVCVIFRNPVSGEWQNAMAG